MRNNWFAWGWGFAFLAIGVTFLLLSIRPEATMYIIGGSILLAITQIKIKER